MARNWLFTRSRIRNGNSRLHNHDIWFAGRLLTPEDRLQSRAKYFP